MENGTRDSIGDFVLAELRAFTNCAPDGDLRAAIMEQVFGRPHGIEQRAQGFVRFVADSCARHRHPVDPAMIADYVAGGGNAR